MLTGYPLPAIMLPPANQSSPFFDMGHSGDKLEFEELEVEFLVPCHRKKPGSFQKWSYRAFFYAHFHLRILLESLSGCESAQAWHNISQRLVQATVGWGRTQTPSDTLAASTEAPGGLSGHGIGLNTRTL